MIEEIIQYNRAFVARQEYIAYKADKYPKKKLAILACMDARLIELLPAALGLKNGDAKIIKNAGGMILNPCDAAIRSLLIAVVELKAEEIMVIAHTECGVQGMEPCSFREHLTDRGITEEAIQAFEQSGTGLEQWFLGFDTPDHSVKNSVTILKNHPLMPADVNIYGFVIDIQTGKLEHV